MKHNFAIIVRDRVWLGILIIALVCSSVLAVDLIRYPQSTDIERYSGIHTDTVLDAKYGITEWYGAKSGSYSSKEWRSHSYYFGLEKGYLEWKNGGDYDFNSLEIIISNGKEDACYLHISISDNEIDEGYSSAFCGEILPIALQEQ